MVKKHIKREKVFMKTEAEMKEIFKETIYQQQQQQQQRSKRSKWKNVYGSQIKNENFVFVFLEKSWFKKKQQQQNIHRFSYSEIVVVVVVVFNSIDNNNKEEWKRKIPVWNFFFTFFLQKLLNFYWKIVLFNCVWCHSFRFRLVFFNHHHHHLY